MFRLIAMCRCVVAAHSLVIVIVTSFSLKNNSLSDMIPSEAENAFLQLVAGQGMYGLDMHSAQVVLCPSNNTHPYLPHTPHTQLCLAHSQPLPQGYPHSFAEPALTSPSTWSPKPTCYWVSAPLVSPCSRLIPSACNRLRRTAGIPSTRPASRATPFS